MIENARALDTLGIGAMSTLNESGHARTHWTIHRFDADAVQWITKNGTIRDVRKGIQLIDFEKHKIQPYSVSEVAGNLITTAGLGRLTSLLTGGSGQALVEARTRLGVGNGDGEAAVSDTDLSAESGDTNRWFQVMATDYPSASNGVVTFQAAFDGDHANFEWTEFGIDVSNTDASSGATVGNLLFNHKTGIAQGTKASGQIWTATATITFS